VALVLKFAAKPEAETVQIGDRKYALRQTDTPEFKKWFGKSKVLTSRDTGPVSGDMIMLRMGIPKEERREYWGGLSQEERDRLTEEYRNVMAQVSLKSCTTALPVTLLSSVQSKPMQSLLLKTQILPKALAAWVKIT
jgi:hypothetical protein